MEFRSLKFMSAGIIAATICGLVAACNNESENNSTSTPVTGVDTANSVTANNSPAETSQATAPAMAKKKKGKISATITEDASAKIEKDKMGYYSRTEVSPAYKGGDGALSDYINNNIEYPQDAIDNNIEGTVSVQFVVDEQGNISNVKTIGNKVGYGLEEEAVKVVSRMPKWTAGQVKGKNVKTWRVLPITYKLES